MALKFYHADNANRTIVSRGISFQFHLYCQHGGTWMGIFETDNPEFIAALDALVPQPSYAVTEISKAEFEAKKKPLPSKRTESIVSPPPSSIPTQIKGEAAAVVVEGRPKLESPEAATNIDEIITLGVVKPFVPIGAPAKKKRGRPSVKLDAE